MSYISQSNKLRVLKLHGQEFIKYAVKALDTATVPVDAGYTYTPAFYSVGGRHFIAVTSPDATLQIFELLDKKIELVDSHQIFERMTTSSSQLLWQETYGRHFIAFMFESHLVVYEFEDNKLQLMGSFKMKHPFRSVRKDVFYKDENFRLKIDDENFEVHFVDLFKKLEKNKK